MIPSGPITDNIGNKNAGLCVFKLLLGLDALYKPPVLSTYLVFAQMVALIHGLVKYLHKNYQFCFGPDSYKKIIP